MKCSSSILALVYEQFLVNKCFNNEPKYKLTLKNY